MSDELHMLIRETVKETVRETLVGLGLNPQDPPSLQADMHYLRQLRRGAEEMARLVRHSVLTLAVSTGLYLLWQAIKAAAGK